jgi:hypothetical protein
MAILTVGAHGTAADRAVHYAAFVPYRPLLGSSMGRCWASLFTPCTAGGTRATAQSVTGLVVTCATAGRAVEAWLEQQADKR